jgi:hypothetical protein
LKRSVDTAWTQDDLTVQTLTNPRAQSVTTTATEAGVSVQSKREQTVDANGNVVAVREYGYPGTLYRTTTTYLTDANYTSRNILNRQVVVTVCAGAAGCATPVSSVATSYDTFDVGPPTAAPGITQHDTAYGATFLYRGNPTKVDANGLLTKVQYDEGGNVLKTKDGQDHEVASAGYSASTGQVQSAASGGNTASWAYNADTTLSSATGSNSDTISFTYGSYRTRTATPPGMGLITYTYSDMDANGNTGNPWTYPFTKTETSAIGRVTATTLDGFGRVTKTAVKETSSPEVWINTKTQYDACSCSSTGKAVKTTRPYRTDASGNLLTGETSNNWTQTNSDALGRPLAVILPDLNQTTYTYSVDSSLQVTKTQVTDPAGKTKRYWYDAFPGRGTQAHQFDRNGALYL